MSVQYSYKELNSHQCNVHYYNSQIRRFNSPRTLARILMQIHVHNPTRHLTLRFQGKPYDEKIMVDKLCNKTRPLVNVTMYKNTLEEVVFHVKGVNFPGKWTCLLCAWLLVECHQNNWHHHALFIHALFFISLSFFFTIKPRQ
jgi:hypothetical protein